MMTTDKWRELSGGGDMNEAGWEQLEWADWPSIRLKFTQVTWLIPYAQSWASECPDVKNYKWRLNRSGTECFI